MYFLKSLNMLLYNPSTLEKEPFQELTKSPNYNDIHAVDEWMQNADHNSKCEIPVKMKTGIIAYLLFLLVPFWYLVD